PCSELCRSPRRARAPSPGDRKYRKLRLPFFLSVSLSSQGCPPIICVSDGVTQRLLPFFSPWTQLPPDRARPVSPVAGDPAPIAQEDPDWFREGRGCA